MKTPLFSDYQFLDAVATGGMNPAFSTVAGAITSLASGAWAQPGLLAPEAATMSFSGMIATATLPSPWGLVASGGLVVRAHGTQTGQDTQTYAVNFASLVPATGTLVAYLAATVTSIQQTPFPIPGPPPGQPAYDPNFVPTVGYAQNVYSVALAAVTGGIDNVNTFELLRTTLTAGQVSVAAFSTLGQVRATGRQAASPLPLASGGILSPAQLQQVLLAAASGLTHTLPPASGSGGLFARYVNPTNGACTIATSDAIDGFGVLGVTSMSVPSLGAAVLWANAASGVWQMLGGSPNLVPHGQQSITATGAFSFTVPANVSWLKWAGWGGGAGGGGSNGIGATGGGGGGGEYREGWLAVYPGQALAGSVAAGGAGGASGGGNGGNGGNTVITGIMQANGGTGGGGSIGGSYNFSAPGGFGGTGGTFNRPGGPGTGAFSTSFGGRGGDTWGLAGAPEGQGAAPGGPGLSPGTGGAGGTDTTGGAGGSGEVVFEW